MKFYLFFILFLVIISCKNENKDFENNKGKIDVYTGIDKFETKESDRFNSEGIELARKSEYEKAEIAFLKALKIEPKNPIILNNLGNVKKYQNEYEESMKYYETSLIVSDSLYFNSALNIGILSYKTKNFTKSLKLLEYVISESDNLKLVEIAYYNLALNYLALNKCDIAKTEFEKSKKILGNNFQYNDQHEYLKIKLKNCLQNN